MTKLEELKAAHEAAVDVYIAAVAAAREASFDVYDTAYDDDYFAAVGIYDAAYTAAAAWDAYKAELKKTH